MTLSSSTGPGLSVIEPLITTQLTHTITSSVSWQRLYTEPHRVWCQHQNKCPCKTDTCSKSVFSFQSHVVTPLCWSSVGSYIMFVLTPGSVWHTAGQPFLTPASGLSSSPSSSSLSILLLPALLLLLHPVTPGSGSSSQGSTVVRPGLPVWWSTVGCRHPAGRHSPRHCQRTVCTLPQWVETSPPSPAGPPPAGAQTPCESLHTFIR